LRQRVQSGVAWQAVVGDHQVIALRLEQALEGLAPVGHLCLALDPRIVERSERQRRVVRRVFQQQQAQPRHAR